MNRYDAIYARQSIDKPDSISIESQIDYCTYEIRGGKYKVFQDKGYSGKNTNRPQFQQMLSAITRGEVSRVVVYKLDRISRSILDFSTMMECFQMHNVEFVSCTEKFDTSTPMGRAMLNICIVFAQLERETIQARVEDAYISRSRKGFYMGGVVPLGYRLEPCTIQGKATSRYTLNPEEAEIVKLIYTMYANAATSSGDIIHYLNDHGIQNPKSDGSWCRSRVFDIVKNPVYVQADLSVYQFFKNQGTIVHNNPEDFIGTNGCYLFSDKSAGRKTVSLQGQHLVLAPHSGFIPSDIWLRARSKCLKSTREERWSLKAKNTWLAGKIKCWNCGRALVARGRTAQSVKYFRCSQQYGAFACTGLRGVKVADVENLVLRQMQEHIGYLANFAVPDQTDISSDMPRVHTLNLKIAQTSSEIEKLLDKVPDADAILLKYINERVRTLDEQMFGFQDELDALLSQERARQHDIGQLQNHMAQWLDLSFDQKREVVDRLIQSVRVGKDDFEIIWKM